MVSGIKFQMHRNITNTLNFWQQVIGSIVIY